MTFGDKLVTLELFHPGGSDNFVFVKIETYSGHGFVFPTIQELTEFLYSHLPTEFLCSNPQPPPPIRHFIVLQFTTLCRYCIFFFLQMEGLRQP